MSERKSELPTDLTYQVRQFLSDELGEPLNRIALEKRLEEDLGVTGDDADELLESFARRFQVSLEGLEFHKHFGPEGCNPLWLLFPPRWLQGHGRFPVTVGHLVCVAEAGRWFEPARMGT